jgi:transposase
MQEVGRRRRWSLDDKKAAVELSLAPDGGVAAVATCCGVSPSQVYTWRREVREAAEAEARKNEPLFVPAVIEREPPRRPGLPDSMVAAVLEIRGVPVRIAHGANPALVASVVALLDKMR